MRRLLAVALLVAGCSSAPKTKTPQDQTLARYDHAGDIAFNLEQPDQAVTGYRAALARARTRDDAGAIADAGFNLGTAEIRAGRPRDALRTAHAVRVELGRRGIVDPQLDLITAIALFRLRDLSAAERAAARLSASKDPMLANAAWFLRGLIADTHHDRAGLEKSLRSMTAAADPADVAELQSRLSHDAALASHAADLRRERMDYRGMARALALAGQFTPVPSEAADLYLRAGRSAAAQGDTADARRWLNKARELARDVPLRHDAEQALRDVPR